MQTIFRRQVMDEIDHYLQTDEVIVLQGARQVGKTSILLYIQRQLQEQGQRVTYIDLEDSRFVAILDRGVSEFITYLREEGQLVDNLVQQGKKLFVMIDEIQYLDNPSSFLKLIADHHRYLKLIVSGSSSFAMKNKFRDSLVGRTIHFEIFPLSFQETLLFRGINFQSGLPNTIKKTAELKALYQEYALFGGYPKVVLTPEVEMKERYLQQILDTYVRKDIHDLAEVRDVNRFNRLLEILASQSGNLLNLTELSNTCGLAFQTVERYLFLLEQTYVLRLVRPFSRNLRSEITKTPKIFFYDTGLMQTLWLKRLQKEVLGPVFETSLFAELIKCLGAEQVYYWRNTNKQEIDFIVRQPDHLLALEAKLQFPRSIPTMLSNFAENTPLELPLPASNEYFVIGLQGEPTTIHMRYPWQVVFSPK